MPSSSKPLSKPQTYSQPSASTVQKPRNKDSSQPTGENFNFATTGRKVDCLEPVVVACRRTHAFLGREARTKILMRNKTYAKKYCSLPRDTTIPEDHGPAGQWHLWEWWAGSARVTSTGERKGLVCGFPVSHCYGWDLGLPHHQAALLKLQAKHKVIILYGAPLCSPWSQSNTTMPEETKALIQQEQLEIFSFFEHACNLQTAAGYFYVF